MNMRRRAGACACLVVLSCGCTMCPDPFDYAGPVPNGSAPQNDFEARSNGILPLGATTKPWPPLVEREGSAAAELAQVASAGDPVADEATAELVIADEPPPAAEAVEVGGSGSGDIGSERLAETPGWRTRSR